MNDTKKEILYMIGLLYEKLGKKEESLRRSSRFTTPNTATAT